MISSAGTVDPRHYWRGAVVIALTIACYRVFVLATMPYGLQGDEAQYWAWAAEPAFGYYSKPPMVAWIIAVTTGLCGDSTFCIRLGSPFIHAGASLLVFLIAEQLYGARAGFWCALAYGLTPAVSFYAVASTTDTPLLLFWALALYGFIRATREDLWSWWLLAGAAVGLGLLSKYNMVIFLVSAVLYLLFSPDHRHHLRHPRPYAAVAIALLIYLPNLAWNVRNGFVSYLHTGEISHVGQQAVSLSGLIEFFGAQFLVFGPIFFALLLYLLFRGPRLFKEDDKRLLLCFIAPWLIVVLTVALLARAHANWSMPVYVAGVVLVVGWLLQQGRLILIRISLALHLLLAGMTYHYDGLTHMLGIELTRSTDPFKQLRGWDVAGQAVAESLRDHPQATLLTNHRMTTAQLFYYAHPDEIVKWNPQGTVRDHYELTTHMQGREGHDFLLVTASDEDSARAIGAYFHSLEKVREIRVPIHRDFKVALDVYLLRDFRGY